MNESQAYWEAVRTQLPVGYKPDKDKPIVVVVNPNGLRNNFASAEYAIAYIENYSAQKKTK